jgi:hypothetical protein
MRTKACELVLRSVCTENLPIILRWRPIVEVVIAGEKLPTGHYDAFAVRDGFADFSDMERFWFETHRGIDRFPGELVRWLAPTSRVAMGTDLMPKREAA